ncbi:metalloregulator ArsR/SmtB family transcription factor [Oceanotoga sp. DSM 15011]|jgi:DNA-binding transcriptional ArsR family regulator|uniref:DNA-binding transcriptional ArsR family regulator n=1 Tax=Oceanotoga teriensis TaxID=515440 RepID=A0AA45C5J0_9BACT|nr:MULTISPECIES: metalloregulator ArsR/SmtB family transcription factor [Oceanotoga]MDN5343426.1 ArsR family transcriptional regulator, lead/cadmium/zinc/bismuth-responsive transcriptional [Oceanotoga sp.]MDO7976423.1 metalloregulator ArsR/SmtB family transcription factor [Oceanotoga teriensis]PWJ89037.1 DNA-binding transcriptional ArsR family regulator [Oceanotoga teriensis]UYP01401.1 metalloregulator ArsR/SmtB family transcription factor [Oceanotoga sp. DSM 15011]
MKKINPKYFQLASEVLSAMGDMTRFKILYELTKKDFLTNSEISENLDMSKSAISHQMRILKNLNLVDYKKDGRNILYFLTDPHIKKIIQIAIEHVDDFIY